MLLQVSGSPPDTILILKDMIYTLWKAETYTVAAKIKA